LKPWGNLVGMTGLGGKLLEVVKSGFRHPASTRPFSIASVLASTFIRLRGAFQLKQLAFALRFKVHAGK
jgi:hypothetical protein